MPPKKKGAGGKKQASDDEYDAAPAPAPAEPEAAAAASGDAQFNMDEEGNDLGGLMSLVAAASRKGAKGKKKKQVDDDEYDVEPLAAQQEATPPPQEEDEPPAQKKGAKGKGGAKGKQAAEDPEEEIRKLAAQLEASALSAKEAAKKKPAAKAPAAPAPAADSGSEDEGEGASGPKSKKQKEKERKARQAAAKKPAAAKAQEKPAAEAAAEDAQPSAGAADEKDDAAKKKRKGPAGLGQLKQLLELQKKAEEEARRLEEEERKRIEEEERQREEEEKRIQEAKRLKKEKEKAKKEELKKQGKYLTKAQKEAQQKQQIRNQQMLQLQGVKVAALAEGEEGVSPSSEAAAEKPKKTKVVYDNRRRKPQDKAAPAASSPVPPASEEATPVEAAEEKPAPSSSEPAAEAAPAEEAPVKASWDEESEPESAPVKASWDDESADEKESEQGEGTAVNEAEDGSDEDDEDDEEEEKTTPEAKSPAKGAVDGKPSAPAQEVAKTSAAEAKAAAAAAARAEEENRELRSPIFVVLGHVDAGKTKLLDKIRQTNVQEGEAGGITQQIGATYFPIDAIKAKTANLRTDGYEYKVPGLLGIDTPGHESFTNLRSRGSSLCNIAILVVDIFNGLEPQTIESLNLLKRGKTPFVVAVNKIDRLYGWKSTPDNSVRESLKDQGINVMQEFETRIQRIVTQFAEQGLNAVLYYENTNFARNVSLVPTSAQTGEGIPDLLNLVVKLTQERMTKSLMYLSKLEATVLEVKVVEGFGTTIDVILSNGVLNEGDRIVVCGLNGPIVTNIRALLTPQPMREIRVKSAYVHHKQVKAALGVKIAANDLDKAIAGSRLLVVGPDDDEEDLMEEVQQDLVGLMGALDKSGKGVCVQASTLGSLEALLSFLQDSKIPVSGINIGPVHKKDVIRASVMLERAREYAQILAFDVKIDKDAEDLAEEVGVKIFQADVIYRLFDQFTAYMNEMTEAKRKDQAPQAVFPAVLRIVPGAVFNKRNPIVIGVDVTEGQLRLGTPLAAVTADRGIVPLGKVTSIELNHKAKEVVKKGEPAVAIKIDCPQYETPKFVGRHFTEKDTIVSHITRQSIDVLKSTFRDDLSKEEWATVVKLKKVLKID